MTPVQIITALRRYDEVLLASGIVPEKARHDIGCLSAQAALRHCRWMIPEAITLATAQHEDSVAKASRWMCFIQGVLWQAKLYTIDQLKDDNR